MLGDWRLELPRKAVGPVLDINTLPVLARLLHSKYCNYETRDTSSPVSGALTDPRLPGARHFAAALSDESSDAVRGWRISQIASSGTFHQTG